MGHISQAWTNLAAPGDGLRDGPHLTVGGCDHVFFLFRVLHLIAI
jgi:hypothetical protein